MAGAAGEKRVNKLFTWVASLSTTKQTQHWEHNLHKYKIYSRTAACGLLFLPASAEDFLLLLLKLKMLDLRHNKQYFSARDCARYFLTHCWSHGWSQGNNSESDNTLLWDLEPLNSTKSIISPISLQTNSKVIPWSELLFRESERFYWQFNVYMLLVQYIVLILL